MHEHPITELDDQSWSELVDKLTCYVALKVGRRYWHGIFGGNLPGGQEVLDVVQSSFLKVLSGQRKWDSQKQPSLYNHLKGVADSEISHLVASWANRRMLQEAQLDSSLDDFRSGAALPVSEVIRREEEELSAQFLTRLHKQLGNEPDLRAMVDCITGGVNKPAEIAENLQLPVQEIYNMRKRLQRRIREMNLMSVQK